MKKYFIYISIVALSVFCITFIVQATQNYEIVTYGDSITAGGTWQPYLEDYFGKKVLNLGIGGAAITRESEHQIALDVKNQCVTRNMGNDFKYIWHRFYIALNRIVKHFDFKSVWQHEISTAKFCSDERLQTIPKEVKIIFIMGGTNDTPTDCTMEEIHSSYEYIISCIRKNSKDARIILLSPPRNINEFKNKEGKDYDHIWYRSRLDSIRNTTIQFALDKGIEFISVVDCGIDSTNLHLTTIDGIHPNRRGGELIGKYIVKKLMEEESPIN